MTKILILSFVIVIVKFFSVLFIIIIVLLPKLHTFQSDFHFHRVTQRDGVILCTLESLQNS